MTAKSTSENKLHGQAKRQAVLSRSVGQWTLAKLREKLIIFGVLALSFLPLSAQPVARPPRPNPAQLALLDQIQGVGFLKFGAKLESFNKNDLKPIVPNPGNSNAVLTFTFVKPDSISWGNLRPVEVHLQFYYGQLTFIGLFFKQERSDLLAASRAFEEKYGMSSDIAVPSTGGFLSGGPSWRAQKIQVIMSIPFRIPEGVDDDYLQAPDTGSVEITDFELAQKLAQTKYDDLGNKVLMSHDLKKIKADL